MIDAARVYFAELRGDLSVVGWVVAVVLSVCAFGYAVDGGVFGLLICGLLWYCADRFLDLRKSGRS